MVNFFFIIALVFTALLSSRRLELFLLVSFSVIFGFILFPYHWDTFGEQYYDYGILLNYENVFTAARAHAGTIQPLFYWFAETFRNLTDLNAVQTINLIRYLIFFLYTCDSCKKSLWPRGS